MTVKKIIKPAFFIVTTLALLYFLLKKIDYISLKEAFLNINLFYLTISFLIILLAPVFSAQKWQSVLKAMDYHISFKDSFKIIMASFPLSAITPSKSGDLIRAYYLKDSLPPARTAGGVMAERLTDISVLLFIPLSEPSFLKMN
jgi:hypothetical protein